MKTKSAGMRYKTMSLGKKNFDDTDENDADFHFTAIATTFGNEDRQGDIIVPGAFTKGLRKVGPKLLWQHKADTPLGTITDITETDEQISFMGNMPKSDTLVFGRVMPQLSIGSLDISIGFQAHKMEFRNGVNHILEGTIFEISLVTIPANPRAVVTGVKSMFNYKDIGMTDQKHQWHASDAIDRLKKLSDNDELEMKFNFLDVVEGEMKAVPFGIFSAAAAIQISKSDDNSEAIEAIEFYYSKMARESPFKKGFSGSELSTLSADDMVSFLRSEPLLSKAGAKFFTEKLFNAGSEKAGDTEADLLQRLNKTLSQLK